MGKLQTLSGDQVWKILARFGFVEVRRRGSHIAMQKKSSSNTVTVPVADHPELRRGKLRSIIRQSGIPREAFE